jgi:hypothetical protein
VEFTPARLIFQTASERLEVAWIELKSIRSLPTFWLICLKGGTQIPLPRAFVSTEALATLQAAAPARAFLAATV